jgi:hypothetical protein
MIQIGKRVWSNSRLNREGKTVESNEYNSRASIYFEKFAGLIIGIEPLEKKRFGIHYPWIS